MRDGSQIKAGTPLRCVDASVRRVVDTALYSDFEKNQLGIIEVMEILTVREVEQHDPFGGAWAVRFVEIERSLEGIRRYRAKKLYAVDRPFCSTGSSSFAMTRMATPSPPPPPPPLASGSTRK